eukprot:102193-Prymnesium_polylepis.1
MVHMHGYTRTQVLMLIRRAKVIVDTCMIGLERLPLEAVSCGAVLLTGAASTCGGAHQEDLPLPPANLLQGEAQLSQAVRRVLDNYPAERAAMEPLRQRYAEEISAASMRQQARGVLEECGAAAPLNRQWIQGGSFVAAACAMAAATTRHDVSHHVLLDHKWRGAHIIAVSGFPRILRLVSCNYKISQCAVSGREPERGC